MITSLTETAPERHLRRQEAAKYVVETYNVPCSPKTLAKLACVSSEGPPFRLAGRFPLYPVSGLDTWAQKKISPLVRSTSEARTAAALPGARIGVGSMTSTKGILIRHPDSARGNDLYETPDVATLALLRAEPLPRTIWEPACGPGAIVRVLRDAGHRVIATDLIDYRSPDQDHAGRDFLLERRVPDGVEMIVTNPPGMLAAQFAAHAVLLCPRVAMLQRLSFLESGNEKTKAGRARLFALDGGHLARVLVFIDRLPMMHRDGWAGNRASNSVAFAWYVWERCYTGKPEIDRISWNRGAS